jgi:hypothetical protein
LAQQDVPEPRRFDPKKLREFVDKEAENFASALTADRVKAREQIRRHIRKITLTPTITDSGRFYEVSGDVSLFTVEEGSLQLDKGESTGLQCTFPLQMIVQASKPWRRRGSAEESEVTSSSATIPTDQPRTLVDAEGYASTESGTRSSVAVLEKGSTTDSDPVSGEHTQEQSESCPPIAYMFATKATSMLPAP